MKEFIDIVKAFHSSDKATIISITPMEGGYLLAVRYEWADGSFTEHVLFIVEEKYGPKRGQRRLGWTHKVYESN